MFRSGGISVGKVTAGLVNAPQFQNPSGTVLARGYAKRKFKNLGSLRPDNPESKWKGYGGKSVEGVVVRAKTDKTVMVQYYSWKRDPTYKVLYKQTTQVMSHDENNICHVGDKVLIVPSRAHSRQKRHEIKKILKKEPGIVFLANNPEYYVDYTNLVIRKAQEEEERKIIILKPEEAREKSRAAKKEAAAVAAAIAAGKTPEEVQALKDSLAAAASGVSNAAAEAQAQIPISTKKVDNRIPTKSKMKKTIPKYPNKATRRRNVHRVHVKSAKPKPFIQDSAVRAGDAGSLAL